MALRRADGRNVAQFPNGKFAVCKAQKRPQGWDIDKAHHGCHWPFRPMANKIKVQNQAN